MKVVLGPVPPSPAGTVKLADLAKDATGCQVIEVAIGMIAGLVIGTIFEDGVWVGRLEAEERAFDFDLPSDWVGLFAANQEPTPISRPSWWSSSKYDVISAAAYPRVIRPDSFCAVLQSQFDHGIAVIPASEVVRAFIAMHSDIATLAFSEPWDIGLAKLVDLDASNVDEHGNWRVVARGKQLRKEWVSSVASLMQVFNPVGARASNMLHATAVAQGGRISAALPFDGCRLRFEARCLKLHPGKYLVVEVTQAQWPHRQGVTLVEPGPLEDLGDDAAQRSYTIDVLALPYDRDEPVDVVSGEAPAQMGETAKGTADAVWYGAPIPEMVVGEARPRPGRSPIPKPNFVASATAVGAPAPSAAVTQASVVQAVRLPACGRFEGTAAMFDQLAASGDIRSWRTLPEPGRPRQVGAREVWSFGMSAPGRSGRWRYVDRKRGIVRSAMVGEIVLSSGRIVYWIEIEPRPGEAFRSLAFGIGSSGASASIRRLLGHAVDTRGIWGDPTALASAVGLRGAAAFRHGTSAGGRATATRAIALLTGLP
ncbi:hypothetical protein ACFPOB_11395 [Bosea eneae]|uniref:Uncharacterized protein n=1 Tax=Bosea eneae TaxID=151454 RepID=A0ABW0IQ58_9HYPH